MQPAMGGGFAASRTPRPWNSRLQTLPTHAIFGFALTSTLGSRPELATMRLNSCATTCPVAFPTVGLVAPMVRNIVGRMTA